MKPPFYVALGLLIFLYAAFAVGFLIFLRKQKGKWLARKGFHSLLKNEFVQIDGTKIHYTVQGPAKAPTISRDFKDILLIHGIGANLYCWRFLQPLLAEHHRVWAIDLRGFGLSEKPYPYSYNLENQSRLVLEFIRIVIKKQAVVVGNSMGGAIALHAGLTTSKSGFGLPGSHLLISDLVLLAPAYDSKLVYFDPGKIKFTTGLFTWLANPWFVKTLVRSLYGTKIDVTEETIHAYMRPYLEEKNAAWALIDSFQCLTDADLKTRISKINVPTLLIWGSLDKLVPVKYAKGIQKSIPHSQLVIHEGGGHHIQEEEPEWLAGQIEKFLG